MILTTMPSSGRAGAASSWRPPSVATSKKPPIVPQAVQRALPESNSLRPLPPGMGPLDKHGNKLSSELAKQKLESAQKRAPMKADHSLVPPPGAYPTAGLHGQTDRPSRSTSRDLTRLSDETGRSRILTNGRRSPSEPRDMRSPAAGKPALLPQTNGGSRPADVGRHLSTLTLHDSSHGVTPGVGSHGGSSGRRSPDQGYGTLDKTDRRRAQSLQRPPQTVAYASGLPKQQPSLVMGTTAGAPHTLGSAGAKPAVAGASVKGRESTSTSSSPSESPTSPATEENAGSSRAGLSSLGSPTSGYSSSASFEDSGKVGLQNLGNTCFMNSVLQCMSNTRPLLKYVLKEHRSEYVNRKSSTMKGSLIRAFVGLMETMWKRDSSDPVAPKDFKSQIQSFAPRFVGYSQQDAQEFLHYVLQGLHEDINRVQQKVKVQPLDEKEEAKYQTDAEKANAYWDRYRMIDNSMIVDIFVGQLRSTLTCQSCRHASTTFDPFWDLSVPIPSRGKSRSISISDCLRAFVEEETLDGDEKPVCSGCRKRTVCTKGFTIQRFPKVLILHLKRFSGERYRSKLTTLVDFPLDGLDLSPCAAPGNRPSRYRLYGIVNHSGSVHSGHYTAYCRHPARESSWYEFNDSRVSAVSASSLVTPEAYVLFYEAVAT